MICVINHKKVQNLVHKLAHCRMSTILSLYYGVASRAYIIVLKHESRKIRYFWVVQKFKVLVFRSGRFGLLPATA